MQQAREILKKYWGHDSFRALQEDIIQKVLEKEDVLALLPTGGGKSICFQVPALLQPGICIVVSPLVALMQDQVSALQKKGIKAMSLTGGIAFSELDQKLDNCIYGNYKFLYLSPERLQQDIVQARIKMMQVSLIAVDEAHCISEWGHDFRPAYRNIRLLRELQPEVPVIGLTASATTPVARDIMEQLEFRTPLILRKSFERKNIAYRVQHAQDKYYRLGQLLRQQSEAAIVYVRSRKATVEIAGFLQKQGMTATFYHAGISQEEKSKRLNQWLSGEKRVMVATNAFGMGIDKPNVRSVVHMNLPESLESYFQEAGRAGRDGRPARAVILTNKSDIPLMKDRFLSALPDVDFVKTVYKKLMAYFSIAYGEGEGETFNFNFATFCETYQLKYQKAYNTLLFLDRLSVLRLSEHFQKKTRFQILSSHQQLSRFLEDNPKHEALIKTILRTYGGAFEDRIEINLSIICSKAGIAPQDALKSLSSLADLNLISFEHDLHDASLTFLVPREDGSTLNPLAPFLKKQIKGKKEKIAGMLRYVANDHQCKSQQLLEYFGEEDARPCGICSVCDPPKKNKLSRERMNEIYRAICAVLGESSLSSREITEQLSFEEPHVIKVMQLLIEKGILVTTPTNTYKLRKS